MIQRETVDVMSLGRSATDEPAVKIRNQIGTAPVEMRGDRRHECGEKSCDEKSARGARQVIHCKKHVTGFRLRELRIKHHDGKRGKNPGPGTQRVMGEVEPENREQVRRARCAR